MKAFCQCIISLNTWHVIYQGNKSRLEFAVAYEVHRIRCAVLRDRQEERPPRSDNLLSQGREDVLIFGQERGSNENSPHD